MQRDVEHSGAIKCDEVKADGVFASAGLKILEGARE